MHYRISFILVTFICLFGFALAGKAQDANTDESSKPVILYSGTPKKYEIADIKVEGVKNYEDYVLIGLSGLSVGQSISVPGDEITSAIKRYWRHGLFSNVKITAEKIEDGKVWLKISLTQRPRISEIRYHGVKKSERQDLETRLGLVKGSQITPNLVDRAKTLIKRYFDDKGFKNAEIIISQKDDISNENQVIVDVNIDKKEKIKVHEITIVGNKAIKTSKLKRVMKKTNEKGKLLNLFRTKKFINEKYEEDKQLIIDKYNELGYRDAVIVTDSVTPYDDKTVNVYMEIDEGDKYYLRNVTWVGNTLYPSEQLNYLLRMKKGDVYNQKLLNERLSTDEDAIGNLYYNNGYLFYNLDPVEINIDGDSIDLEMRIYEGRQATINKIKINGNDRLYENVVRRELRTRPGQYAAKWYDVAGYLYDLPVDWSVGFYGIGLKRWQQLPPEVQQLLQAQSKVLEDALWQETARENRYAKACNVGSPDCQIHQLAHMSASAPDAQEQQRVRQMALEIANDWGRRCGPSCVEQWNASAGRAIGMRLAP